MSDTPDLSAITKRFFAAYDAHDVEGMLALCADGAEGRYLPYGKNSAMPIRGGLEEIWRGLPQAVPDFGVEIVELIEGEDNAVMVQALLGGTMPADVPSVVKKGEVDRIAHAYIFRFNAGGAWTVTGTTPLSTLSRPAPCKRNTEEPDEQVPGIFDAQKALFASGVTRTYEWRVKQLDCMARMIRENEARFQEAMAKEFKTASQEYIFETQASAGEPRCRRCNSRDG
jgi:hypothetical protein